MLCASDWLTHRRCNEPLFSSFPSHPEPADRDRKSTRLNSSHANISYAVFCLKKKKTSNSSSTSTPPRGSAYTNSTRLDSIHAHNSYVSFCCRKRKRLTSTHKTESTQRQSCK